MHWNLLLRPEHFWAADAGWRTTFRQYKFLVFPLSHIFDSLVVMEEVVASILKHLLHRELHSMPMTHITWMQYQSESLCNVHERTSVVHSIFPVRRRLWAPNWMEKLLSMSRRHHQRSEISILTLCVHDSQASQSDRISQLSGSWKILKSQFIGHLDDLAAFEMNLPQESHGCGIIRLGRQLK